MSASHPTFARGHCFMTETLSKPEVEYLGPLLMSRLVQIEGFLKPRATQNSEEVRDARWEADMLATILKKMDYPVRSGS